MFGRPGRAMLGDALPASHFIGTGQKLIGGESMGIITRTVLKAYKRKLERQIEVTFFDAELSRKLDMVNELLET